jgi:hypothetical protein
MAELTPKEIARREKLQREKPQRSIHSGRLYRPV